MLLFYSGSLPLCPNQSTLSPAGLFILTVDRVWRGQLRRGGWGGSAAQVPGWPGGLSAFSLQAAPDAALGHRPDARRQRARLGRASQAGHRAPREPLRGEALGHHPQAERAPPTARWEKSRWIEDNLVSLPRQCPLPWPLLLILIHRKLVFTQFPFCSHSSPRLRTTSRNGAPRSEASLRSASPTRLRNAWA